MGGLGQSSDPAGPAYHANGLPLVPGLIEVVTSATAAAGQRHAGLTVGKIAIRSWRGEPANPTTQTGGVGWILASNWKPYQRSTFVTPAFAGYISGHSTFSRAAAEVLTAFTGSPYFPGGLGSHTEYPGELDFEYGPSSTVQLQWSTYYDAADQAGISRLFGGIHVAADDGPGRVIGATIGHAAFQKALPYMDGSVLSDFRCGLAIQGASRVISWKCLPGYQYQVQWSDSLDEADFQNLTTPQSYDAPTASIVDDATVVGLRRFYRVVRISP